MLYPKMTATRTLTTLDGMWQFQPEKHVQDPAEPLDNPTWVAVPGSFNSQLLDEELNNSVGYFWYATTFQMPLEQLKRQNFLRFGSVSHQAEVYLNGHLVTKHVGGFTPFEANIDKFLKEGTNDLKVRVCNILDDTTLPSAKYDRESGKITYRFDFFNFTGIHRPVRLYSTNETYLTSVHVNYQTDLKQTVVTPQVKINGVYDHCEYVILDQNGKKVVKAKDNEKLLISDTHLWQPNHGYLYQLVVNVMDEEGELLDTYTKEFGVRTVKVTKNQFLINDKPFYFQGFGKHEDFFASGKGLNMPLITLDHQILKSLGANSYRTSHYPYSEEQMQQADRDGIVIIDEVPAVGLFVGFNVNVEIPQKGQTTWNTLKTATNHELAIKEMMERDVDHPAVVMWSLANETAGHEDGAHEYYAPLVKLARSLDPQHRPMTWIDIMVDSAEKNQIGDLFDVICLNRYYGWYVAHGDLETAGKMLTAEIKKWHERYPEKPIMFTEFGADTVSGMHTINHSPYSEEYQTDFYRMYFKVFDQFDYIVGEQLWAFADFQTSSSMIRVDGNLKGVFTRDRRPKQVVGLLKQRWLHDYDDRCHKVK
ncbi:MAG: beta-glucuronidase [Lactobacillus sp.]|nr:beta-glucuronidase [Lactobacillus sp.]